MDIKFYDVKSRQSVMLDESAVKKTKYTRKTTKGTQVRYALRGSYQGRFLTKFVSEADWMKLSAPEV